MWRCRRCNCRVSFEWESPAGVVLAGLSCVCLWLTFIPTSFFMGFFSFLGGYSSSDSRYAPFVNYFKAKPLGSEPPVMTILSNLPPKDRCGILSEVLKNDPSNINVYDKLSMAYLKNNQLSEALNCLENGRRSRNLSGQNFMVLKDKIDSMNVQIGGRFGSSENYAESIQRIDRDYNQTRNLGYDFSEFAGIAKSFCQKQSK